MKAPYLFVLAGPNGSGKTSAYNRIARITQTSLPMLNADEVERAECRHISRPDKRSQAAQKLCEARREEYLAAGLDFGFETVGSHPSKHQFMHRAQGLGYDVELLFISTADPQINLARVAQRVAEGGHDVPAEKIIQRWYRTMSMLPSYIAASNSATVLDNSQQLLRPLLSTFEANVTIHPAFYEVAWPREVLDGLLLGINLTPSELVAAKNKLEDMRSNTGL